MYEYCILCITYREFTDVQHLRTLTLLRGESECEQRVALGANETRAITESECRETRAVSDAIGLRVTSILTRKPADSSAEGSARPAARLFSDGMCTGPAPCRLVRCGISTGTDEVYAPSLSFAPDFIQSVPIVGYTTRLVSPVFESCFSHFTSSSARNLRLKLVFYEVWNSRFD